MTRNFTLKLFLVAAGLATAVLVQGAVLNGNFCSSADVDNPELNGFLGFGMYGFEQAGIATPAGGYWNDLTSATNTVDSVTFGSIDTAYGAGSQALPGNDPNRLFYADGTAAPSRFRISWSAEIQDRNDDYTQADNRHEQMMAGYLGSAASDLSTATITLNSAHLADAFTMAPYDLYVYFDGDADYEGVLTRVEALGAPLSGTGDNVYVLPSGDFVANSPGDLGDYMSGAGGTITAPVVGANYMLFENLVGDFAVTISATAPEGESAAVALNGFEIVGVPEPSTMLLLIMVGGLGLIRRRHS